MVIHQPYKLSDLPVCCYVPLYKCKQWWNNKLLPWYRI